MTRGPATLYSGPKAQGRVRQVLAGTSYSSLGDLSQHHCMGVPLPSSSRLIHKGGISLPDESKSEVWAMKGMPRAFI